jgi:hypothetical protein
MFKLYPVQHLTSYANTFILNSLMYLPQQCGVWMPDAFGRSIIFFYFKWYEFSSLDKCSSIVHLGLQEDFLQTFLTKQKCQLKKYIFSESITRNQMRWKVKKQYQVKNWNWFALLKKPNDDVMWAGKLLDGISKLQPKWA